MFDPVTLPETNVFERQQAMIDAEADYFAELMQWMLSAQGLSTVITSAITAALALTGVKLKDASIQDIVVAMTTDEVLKTIGAAVAKEVGSRKPIPIRH